MCKDDLDSLFFRYAFDYRLYHPTTRNVQGPRDDVQDQRKHNWRLTTQKQKQKQRLDQKVWLLT